MSIQRIRDNSQGLVAKIIIGVIVITFALFGVDAIVGYSSATNKVATVNGTDISDIQLAQAEAFMTRQLLAQMGERADPSLIDEQLVSRQALDNLITRQLLLDDAKNQSLHVSDKRVNTVILNTPTFQTNGVFDRSVYESALRTVSMSPLDYKDQLSQDLLVQQPQAAISQSVFITQTEVEQIAKLDRQLRNISYLTIPVTKIENLLISDDNVLAYYNTHQADFMKEENTTVEYLELKRTDFTSKVEVSDSEIEQQYDQEVKSYSSREERQASHILVETNDISEAEAVKKLEEARAALKAGESFSDVAKKYSDDSGSSENGGDLGFSERGAFVGPFEDTLFAMKEGEVSDIIETDFGLHIIKLAAIRTPEIPSLESIRKKLIEEIKFQKSEELFVAAVDELQNDSFSAGDLQEPAENLKLTVQITQPFTRAVGEGIASQEKVRNTAFSDELINDGVNSELIEITQDHVVVIRSKNYQPAVLRSIEDVTETIKTTLLSIAAREKAQKQGEEIIAKIDTGTSLETVANDYSSQWTTLGKATRNQAELEPRLNRIFFKMPKPESGKQSLGHFVQDDGAYTVMVLTDVITPDIKLNPNEVEVLSGFIARQRGTLNLSEYQADLRDKADIEKL